MRRFVECLSKCLSVLAARLPQAGIAEPVESVSAAESADGVAEMPAPPLAPPPACPNTALFSSSDELLEGAEAFMRDQRVSRAPSPPPGGAVNGGADPPVGRYDVNRNRRSGAGAASCSADAASCSAGASNVGRSRRWTLRYYYDGMSPGAVRPRFR